MADYNFNVIVKDQNNNLVDDANITMYDSLGNVAFTSKTNNLGVFTSNKVVSDLNNPKEIEVLKDGYEDVLLYLNISQNITDFFIKLNSYSTNYADINDVRQYLQLNNMAFTPNKVVNDSVIADRIKENEIVIDNYCRRSWKETEKTEYFNLGYTDKTADGFVPIYLTHSRIFDFSSASGDIISNWNGSEWVDYLTNKSEGRNKDFWVDNEKGILYIKPTHYGNKVLKITYRYGNETLPLDVKKATIMLVCSDLLMFDNNSNTLPDGYSSSISYSDKASRLTRMAYNILDNYKNMFYSY